jgi:DNA-binding GntR family transcriptional regulator
MSCSELSDELQLPRHVVKLALVRLGMEGLVERDVTAAGLHLAETWRAVMSQRWTPE